MEEIRKGAGSLRNVREELKQMPVMGGAFGHSPSAPQSPSIKTKKIINSDRY